MIEKLKNIIFFIRYLLSPFDSRKNGNNQLECPNHPVFCGIHSNPGKWTGMIKIIFWYIVSILISMAVGNLR